MTLQAKNRRGERRLHGADLLYPVSFAFRAGTRRSELRLVNYHHRGACVEVTQEIVEQLEVGPPPSLDFYVGEKCVLSDIPYRIAWQTTKSDGLIGLEFHKSVAPYIHRSHRFPAHRFLVPIVTASDPVDANRKILFSVVNLSTSGLLLKTSLTNAQLMAGLELDRAQIAFPGNDPILVDLKITHTRKSDDDDIFLVGTRIVGNPKKYLTVSKRYISALSPITDVPDRAALLAEGGMLSCSLKDSLTFRLIKSTEDYEAVLKLRLMAYQKHGKADLKASWMSQGDGLNNEGMILGGYLGGELISSFEMRFGKSGIPLRSVDIFKGCDLSGVNVNEVVEVNKLVIHPKIQGSDVIVGMLQKGHSILLANGKLDVLIASTNKLLRIYRRAGFKKVGPAVPHAKINGEQLHLMRLSSAVYLRAKYINAYYWHFIARANHQQLTKYGITKRLRLSPIQQFQVIVFGFLRDLFKVFKTWKGDRKTHKTDGANSRTPEKFRKAG